MYLDPNTYSTTNRHALLSLLLAVLALFSFCIGAAPLPLPSLFCYPSSLLLGIGALWAGSKALQQIRQTDESGKSLAKIGIWVGSLTILFVVCAITFVIMFAPYLLEYLKETWAQISSN